LNNTTREANKTIESYTSGHFGLGAQESLSSPAKKREELQRMKEAMQTYQDMKSQKIFIKKRNRLMQNGWRDGVLGVEIPGDAETSYFYTPEILR
jgi:hypothetical protein